MRLFHRRLDELWFARVARGSCRVRIRGTARDGSPAPPKAGFGCTESQMSPLVPRQIIATLPPTRGLYIFKAGKALPLSELKAALNAGEYILFGIRTKDK